MSGENVTMGILKAYPILDDFLRTRGFWEKSLDLPPTGDRNRRLSLCSESGAHPVITDVDDLIHSGLEVPGDGLGWIDTET